MGDAVQDGEAELSWAPRSPWRSGLVTFRQVLCKALVGSIAGQLQVCIVITYLEVEAEQPGEWKFGVERQV